MAEMETKEVSVVKQQATKAVNAAGEFSIKTPEDMQKATDWLGRIKQIAKDLKARKEEITKPLNEALLSARDLFRKPEADLAEAERVIKDKMLDWQEKEDERINKAKNKVIDQVEAGKISVEKGVAKMEKIDDAPVAVQGKTSAVAFRTVKKYRVVDESKLPREFLVPNMAKITEALKAGVPVPGAEMYEEKVVASSSQLKADDPLLGQK